MTTNTNNETSEQVEQVKALPKRTLTSLLSKVTALHNVETTENALVADAEWHRFDAMLRANVALGNVLSGDSIAGKLTGNVTGDAIRKAMADKQSGIYVEDRSALPSGSVFSRAMDVARLDTADRRKRYREQGNAPKLQDFVLWAKLDAAVNSGEDPAKVLGNRSKVDLSATVTTDDKGTTTVGKVVRVPGTARTTTAPSSAKVVGFFADLLSMSPDELRQVVADGPTDIDSIPESVRRDLAKQLMAAVVLSEQTAKVVVKL